MPLILDATGFLQETYPHSTCSKGLSLWIEKHNRYPCVYPVLPSCVGCICTLF